MKRLKLIACFGILLLGCLGMASCSVEEEISKAGADGSITLQLNSSLINTRATVPGNDAFNENEINDVHVFFYPASGTGNALQHRHVAKASITEVSNVKGTTTITFPSSEMTDVFPSNATKAVVYAIANLPADAVIPTTDTSIESLKKIAITADFSQKQASFVMDGQAEVTLNRTTMKVAGEIDLKRAASQIALFVTDIKGEVEDVDGKTWIADPKGMQVEFYNGVKDATVDVTVDDTYTVADESYVSTAQTRDFADAKAGEGEDAAYAQELPFYSYSSDWSGSTENTAYMKLIVPWKKEGEETFRSCFYMVPINLEGQKFERNTYYKIMISVEILGSFLPDQPFELTPSYVIMNWSSETFSASIDEYKYLVVDETEKNIFNVEDCKIAYSSSSPITVKVTKVEYPSYITGDEVIKEISAGTATVNKDNTFTLSHSLVDPSENRVPYTFYLTVTNEDGMSEDVVIVQYPSLYIGVNPGGNVFVNGYFANVVPSPGFGVEKNNKGISGIDAYYHSYDYTTAANNTSSTANAYLSSNNADASRVWTGYGTVQSGPTASYLTMKNQINVYVTAFNSTNSTYSDGVGGTYTYRIGDPRVPGEYRSNNLNPYLKGQSQNGTNYLRDTQSWSEEEASAIQIATSEKDVIASAFKVASPWGRLGSTGLDFDKAKKRCATYQEAGYPAGRWRLPTEAEIAFLLDLQERKLIPQLFNMSSGSNTRYWASSERVFLRGQFLASTADKGFTHGVLAPLAPAHFARCVYDIWYWGEAPYSTDTNKYIVDAPKQ
ncbi:MAG: hypothetical protein LBV32_02690 [Tannerellaceae bacterium]|jgi:hypothetical protein|nr:hypothetical protein [Tannerellaceae bacterium]